MKRIIPLTPRRWLALEIFRRMKHYGAQYKMWHE